MTRCGELLARLWRDGPEPGEGLSLLRASRRRGGDATLLVFSRVALLCDEAAAGGRLDLTGADEDTRALAAVVERWRRMDPRPARMEGSAAVQAWAQLAQGQAELAAGRDRLLRVLHDEAAPLRARLVAGWSAAGPEASGRADVDLRVEIMGTVAELARDPRPAQLAAALLEVAHGRQGVGHKLLLRMVDRPAGGPSPVWVDDLVEEAFAAAHRRRDTWSASLIARASGRA